MISGGFQHGKLHGQLRGINGLRELQGAVPIVNPELLEDVLQMEPDGPFADTQGAANLLVGKPTLKQPDDLRLARRKAAVVSAR